MSVRVMTRVWSSDLARNEKLVLLALADFADDDGGSVFPSLGLVAWKTGYEDVRQVRRIVSSLREQGILREVRAAKRYRPTGYRIVFERLTPLPPFRMSDDISGLDDRPDISTDGRCADDPRADNPAPQGRHPRQQGGHDEPQGGHWSPEGGHRDPPNHQVEPSSEASSHTPGTYSQGSESLRAPARARAEESDPANSRRKTPDFRRGAKWIKVRGEAGDEVVPQWAPGSDESPEPDAVVDTTAPDPGEVTVVSDLDEGVTGGQLYNRLYNRKPPTWVKDGTTGLNCGT